MAAVCDATAEEVAESKRVHEVWRAASDELEEAELVLSHAQERMEYAREAEATSTRAYLDFHDAYWAKRENP